MRVLPVCGQTAGEGIPRIPSPASSTILYDVTSAGEIIRSEDGEHWMVFDFNTFYQGYYTPCRFTCILSTPRRIAVAGVDAEGTPVLYLSAQGNVWSPRNLDYTDSDGNRSYLKEVPHTITYDTARDLLFLECSSGRMIIPSCSHCNEWHHFHKHTRTTNAQRQGCNVSDSSRASWHTH